MVRLELQIGGRLTHAVSLRLASWVSFPMTTVDSVFDGFQFVDLGRSLRLGEWVGEVTKEDAVFLGDTGVVGSSDTGDVLLG